MAYLGNTPAEKYTSIDKQTITGNGGTGYTLDHSVANEQEIEVFVNNVRQEPGIAYTVNGTALTMTGNVESTDDFYVIFQGKAVQTVTHPSDQNLNAVNGTFTGEVDIENIRIDNNTISSTDTNGDITVAPNGTGDLVFKGSNPGADTKLHVRNTDGVSTASNAATLHLESTSSASHGGKIQSLFTGTVDTNHACDLILSTSTASSVMTERLRLDSEGEAILTGNLRQTSVQAVVAELGSTGFTTANTWVNLGGVSLPQSGIWMIKANLRLRGGGAGFVKSRLGTTTSGGEIGSNGGGGANTAIRMLKEQVAHEGSFYNLHVAPSWILDCPVGATYPLAIYIHVAPSASDSQNLNNNDTNGHPTLTAIRLNGTDTTGSTVETIGGA